jgi:sterol desaturase/sphingolipid hydroxylase (fatty acid hydroxylase superfamily)
MAILLGIVFTFCVIHNSIYKHTMADAFQFLREYGHELYQTMVFNSIFVCLAARLTNYEDAYAWVDLAFLPVYAAVWLMTAETFYYFFHIAMHRNRFLFKYVHSMHHKPEYSAALQAFHVHPIESISGFVVPLIWVFILTKRLHVLNFYSTLGAQFFIGFNAHSASTVNLLPNWIFSHPAKHEVHHKGNGNFAPLFGFFDPWLGTAIHVGNELEYLRKQQNQKFASTNAQSSLAVPKIQISNTNHKID